MSKYYPLEEHLSRSGGEFVSMRFGDIEDVLGFRLPSSARNYRAWWSNSTSNNAMTNAWMSAGYRSENVDMEGERLVFRRVRRAPGTDRQPISAAPGDHDEGPNANNDTSAKPERRSIVGVLEGTVTFDVGTKLTEPLDVTWNAER